MPVPHGGPSPPAPVPNPATAAGILAQVKTQAPPLLSQPKTIKLSLNSVLALPHRLTHPPPAKGQINSWGITPTFRISLDDILDRKHLPPLGLKDFEEWLLFVERTSENLYFILWLREYTTRYAAWAHQSRAPPAPSAAPPGTTHAHRSQPPPNPPLGLFCLRAKQTFLAPGAPYALSVPSALLAPFRPASFHASEGSCRGSDGVPDASETHSRVSDALPPDPAVFAELADVVRGALAESLARFVEATYNNVGTHRAHCGSAGGIVMFCVGSLPIIIANFVTGGSRWWRITALPGMWIGLTVLISAMYGVCMMIYVFGDLRQLRSFELARPPISQPQPVSSTVFLSGPRPALSPFSLRSWLPHTNTGLQHSPAPPSMATAVSGITPITRPPRPVFVFPSRERDTKNGWDTRNVRDARGARPNLRIDPNAVAAPPLESRWSVDTDMPREPQSAVTKVRSASQATSLPFASFSEPASINDFPSTPIKASKRPTSCTSSKMYSQDIKGLDGDSDSDEGYGDSESESGEGGVRIHISEAYYDEHPSPEGPATAVGAFSPFANGHSVWSEYADGEGSATAAFIHPYVEEDIDFKFGTPADDVEARAADRQRISSFDFDGLPPRRPKLEQTRRSGPQTSGSHKQTSLPGSYTQKSTSGSHQTPITGTYTQILEVAQGRGVNLKVHEQDVTVNGRYGVKTNARDMGTNSRDAKDGRDSKINGRPAKVRFTDLRNPRSVLGYLQSRCSPNNAVTAALAQRDGQDEFDAKDVSGDVEKRAFDRNSNAYDEKSPSALHENNNSAFGLVDKNVADTEKSGWYDAVEPVPKKRSWSEAGKSNTRVTWRDRFRKVAAVPAFASPLTPVLSPVVTRAQWEIVVRSMLMAALISCTVIAALLGAPVPR